MRSPTSKKGMRGRRSSSRSPDQGRPQESLPVFAIYSLSPIGEGRGRPYSDDMVLCSAYDTPLDLRQTPNPSPPPIKEPPDGPENPDVPVREPDPVEPSEI